MTFVVLDADNEEGEQEFEQDEQTDPGAMSYEVWCTSRSIMPQKLPLAPVKIAMDITHRVTVFCNVPLSHTLHSPPETPIPCSWGTGPAGAG